MAKKGRPRKEIDKRQFENLCGLQCTLNEIASFFDCSIDTVERFCKREYGSTFADTFNKYAGVGKISLRRTQFKLAERSASMAIWLGKQVLGQEDRIAVQTIDPKTLDELEQAVLLSEKENEHNNETAGEEPTD